MINRYGPMMDTNVVVPTGPATCRVIFDWYFDDTCDAAFMEESIRSSEQVQDEDIAICEKLQRGLSSRNCQPGPYVPSLEHGKYYFHQLLAGDTSGHKKSAGQ
jgi:choline monooxygenase